MQPGRVCLIASWDGEHAVKEFLDHHPLARELAGGWRARLEPVRSPGAWPALPELPGPAGGNVDGPVAVLTLGRLRLRRASPFLAASLRAEREALAHPAMLAVGTALARPPRLVATFSVWRDGSEMRDFVVSPEGHRRAIEAHRAEPFHHESVFIRFRLHDSAGLWDGRDRRW